MQSIEQRILAYPHLPVEEREAVEAYVADHPEWRDLLHDIKKLEALAEEARLLRETPPRDEVLALYVVATRLYEGPLSPAMQQAFDAVEARLGHDADFKAQYDLFVQHMDEVEAAFDPVAQFETLSGHRVSKTTSGPASPPNDDRPHRAPTSGRRSSKSPATDRSLMARLLPSSATLRWVVAVAVVLVVSYAGLFVASYATQAPAERLAAVDLDETEIGGYHTRTRSATPQPDLSPSDQRFLEALATLRDARSTTLGLFPRYDTQALAHAEELLEDVADREASGDFLQLEALFFLGKIDLAQGDIEQARSDFKRVVTGEGRRMQEALNILEELQRQYPAQPQDAR